MRLISAGRHVYSREIPVPGTGVSRAFENFVHLRTALKHPGMIKRFFSPSPLWQQNGLVLIRLMVGSFITYHGFEVFDHQKMDDYAKRLTDLHFQSPLLMAYLGKGTEFGGGILLLAGFLTRLAIIPLVITMLVIIFGMGKGDVFMDDQHPFLFILLFLVLFFCGPGRFSLDQIVFRQKDRTIDPLNNNSKDI